MKTCQTCHQSKPLAQFYVNLAQPDGYAVSCRKCARAAGRSNIAEDEKFCPRCAKVLPLPAFHKNRRRHDGVQQYCKDCTQLYAGNYYRTAAHDNIVAREYGLGRGQYAAMLEAQGGVCAICHQPERAKFGGKLKKLAVDHDHATGRARALLCAFCNAIIGYAEDSVERLEAAIEYLKNPPPLVAEWVTPPRRPAARCGTASGVLAHYRRGEKPCEVCIEFRKAEYAKKREEAGRPQRPVAVCGTEGGRRAHYTRGEKPCEACRAARATLRNASKNS